MRIIQRVLIFPHPCRKEWYVTLAYTNYYWKICPGREKELSEILREAEEKILKIIGSSGIVIDESAILFFWLSLVRKDREGIREWVRKIVLPFDGDPKKYFEYLENEEWENIHDYGMSFRSVKENEELSKLVKIHPNTKKKIERLLPKIQRILEDFLSQKLWPFEFPPL